MIIALLGPTVLICVFIGAIVIVNVVFCAISNRGDSRFHETQSIPAAISLGTLAVLHEEFAEKPGSHASNQPVGRTKFSHLRVGERTQLVAVADGPIDISGHNVRKTLSVSSSSDVTLRKSVESGYIYARNVWAHGAQVIRVTILAGVEEVGLACEELHAGRFLVGHYGEVQVDRLVCRQISGPHLRLIKTGAQGEVKSNSATPPNPPNSLVDYFPDGTIIDRPVVCHGNLIVGNSVTFTSDLKVRGQLITGEQCEIHGTVVADGTIRMGGRARLFGDVVAKSELIVGADAKFGRNAGQQVHVATQSLSMLGSTILHGTLISALPHGVRYV